MAANLVQAAVLAVPLLALLAAAVIVQRGLLRESALAGAPPRQVGFTPGDLLVALFLFLAGAMLVPLARGLLDAWGLLAPAPEAADQREAMSPRRLAMLALLGQLMIQGPMAAYVLIRAATVARGWRELGVVPRRPGRELWMTLVGLAAALPLAFTATLLGQLLARRVGHESPVLSHDMLRVMVAADPTTLAVLLFSAVVLAPVFEEIIFRGLVQTALLEMLGRHRRWPAILLASLIFTVVHHGSVWVFALPGLFVLSLVLGWLYERSGSLLPPILLHLAFNVFNAAMVLTVARPA